MAWVLFFKIKQTCYIAKTCHWPFLTRVEVRDLRRLLSGHSALRSSFIPQMLFHQRLCAHSGVQITGGCPQRSLCGGVRALGASWPDLRPPSCFLQWPGQGSHQLESQAVSTLPGQGAPARPASPALGTECRPLGINPGESKLSPRPLVELLPRGWPEGAQPARPRRSSAALKPLGTAASRASQLGGKGWTPGRSRCGGHRGGVLGRAALPLVLIGTWVMQGGPGRREVPWGRGRGGQGVAGPPPEQPGTWQ